MKNFEGYLSKSGRISALAMNKKYKECVGSVWQCISMAFASDDIAKLITKITGLKNHQQVYEAHKSDIYDFLHIGTVREIHRGENVIYTKIKCSVYGVLRYFAYIENEKIDAKRAEQKAIEKEKERIKKEAYEKEKTAIACRKVKRVAYK